jgi:hypothetical protein
VPGQAATLGCLADVPERRFEFKRGSGFIQDSLVNPFSPSLDMDARMSMPIDADQKRTHLVKSRSAKTS